MVRVLTPVLAATFETDGMALSRRAAATLAFGIGVSAIVGPAAADKIKNPTAVFSGLDKITGRIIAFEVAVDETVQFGALQLTTRSCFSRPQTEAPNTTAFVEVEEVTFTNEHKRIFGGWMFASSPGLHGIEHPVYDLWLTECKGGTEIIAEAKEVDPADEQLKKDAATAQQRQQQQRRQQANQPGQAGLQGQPGQPGQPGPRQRFFPNDERAVVREPPPPAQPRRQPNFFEQLFGGGR
jgi:hypothetical protein